MEILQLKPISKEEETLVIAEATALHEWQESNYSTNTSGHADVKLTDGRLLCVRAGWNVNSPHDGCELHVPVGRTSTACFYYAVEGRSLTRAEARLMLEVD